MVEEQIYKVSCEFYVKAENEKQAEERLKEEQVDNDFVESHIIIEPSNLPENEDLWEDYTKEETETNDFVLCDDCQTSITEEKYNKNKGLCDDCVYKIQ